MYGQNKIKKMPDFIKNYDLWDKYMGNVWSHLMQYIHVGISSTVIDIAPGASAKIEYALKNIDFAGTLYIIEPQKKVAKVIYYKAKKILPLARIILLEQPLHKITIEEKVDAVFSNHPFDDFISGKLITQTTDFNIMFNDISKEELSAINVLKNAWSATPEKIERAKKVVFDEFKNFIIKYRPQHFIINQYPSSYFKKNHLDIVNYNATDLFEKVKAVFLKENSIKIQNILNLNENYSNEHIGDVILDAQNWIVYEKY